MSLLKNLSSILLLILIVSCNSSKKGVVETDLAKNQFIYWVNDSKVECVGVAPMQCMQVKKAENIDEGDWQLFYFDIEGFNYEQGYLYKLIVEETEIPLEQVPADASSVKYRLIKVVEKNKRKEEKGADRINGIWELEEMRSRTPSEIKEMYKKIPTLIIDINEKRISGNDGCNNYSAKIEALTDYEIKFETPGGTKKFCDEMWKYNTFIGELTRIREYAVKDYKLMLYDETGTKILTLSRLK